MDLLRNVARYEANKKKRDAKVYKFVRKQKLGNVERIIWQKPVDNKMVEYVKYNGKYMQLKNYEAMMKRKDFWKQVRIFNNRLFTKKPESPKKPKSPGRQCKKDCESINKVCNKKSGRCNVPPKVKPGFKQCKRHCVAFGKVCNKSTGRCNKASNNHFSSSSSSSSSSNNHSSSSSSSSSSM
jgi:hypothetical protein